VTPGAPTAYRASVHVARTDGVREKRLHHRGTETQRKKSIHFSAASSFQERICSPISLFSSRHTARQLLFLREAFLWASVPSMRRPSRSRTKSEKAPTRGTATATLPSALLVGSFEPGAMLGSVQVRRLNLRDGLPLVPLVQLARDLGTDRGRLDWAVCCSLVVSALSDLSFDSGGSSVRAARPGRRGV
jgi:hypothetical protein